MKLHRGDILWLYFEFEPSKAEGILLVIDTFWYFKATKLQKALYPDPSWDHSLLTTVSLSSCDLGLPAIHLPHHFSLSLASRTVQVLQVLC
jgi:hypothetical protein